MTEQRLCTECKRSFDSEDDSSICPACEDAELEDELPGKVDHQRALDVSDAYIRLEQTLPGCVGERNVTLARCYKHNRAQLAEARARIKELEKRGKDQS